MGDRETPDRGHELDDLDLEPFVGRPVADLREAVEVLNGFVRELQPGDVVTLEYRGDRVDAIVDDAGVVQDVRRS